MLSDIRTAVLPFEAAVVSKVPDLLKSTVQSLGNRVVSSLNTGIVAFGGTVESRNGIAGVSD
jgi:hypothetical protein